ncbi:SusD/RagB family nutrient-binding outer membrane lipoprotein [Lacinutrix sp. Bg11-31]|uniref:SusD/RagB family nutrient-binding outer membrane lipoprotein n=1 Tax=Lacinutrix sp. Bg11-31 TaxID=2057808 RepID=UPI000C300EC9|nr:SusD/RagB family nutrient-binding outer membrane lipoprotein [Lacinutrix sp. Bg11-31]AUC80689.1 hypothetical protein CW733_00465 [Lacinutrix sp. Bg11-31]
MKKKLTFVFATTLLLFTFFACNSDDDVNNQEETVNIVTEENLPDIIRALSNTNYRVEASGDMGIAWSQQIQKLQYNDETRYIPRQGEVDNIWSSLYSRIDDIEALINYAEANDNDNLKATALVLKVYTFALITDLFGDVPYFEASISDTPAYDLQETIYGELISTLEQSNQLFNTTDVINSNFDVLYQGDANKWKRFSNSLKFKILMRASNNLSVNAQLQELIDNGNLFNANTEEAKYNYSGIGDDKNPIHETIVEGERHEYRSSAVLFSHLNNGLDPRTSKMIGLNQNGEYVFGGFDGLISPIAELYLRADAPGYFLSYSELEFLITEAAYKGYINVPVESHYNAGVMASFKANELTNDEALSFLSTNPYDSSNALEQIGIQKYLALFCQGFEAWTEYRRTGFPELIPPVDAVLDQVPSRLNYPIFEQTTNTVNYNQAVLSQGEDNLITPLWWQE